MTARWCESGEIAWCEFVRDDDPEGRTPGTYVAVRLDNPDAEIRRMHVTITEADA